MKTVLAVLLALFAAAGPATSQELKIGLSAEPTSMDPLFFNFGPNTLVRNHVFDQLISLDSDGRLLPALATRWAPVDATTWEFQLRDGVRFHDGSPLTPEDVAFSIERAAKVPNSPNSFAMYTRDITAIDITGPSTLRVHTSAPDGFVPRNLAQIAIQSKHVVEGKGTNDFNTGAAMIGTGPYRFVSWQPGAPVLLARNDAYWGGQPHWATVVLRPFVGNATREVALDTGEADLVQALPPQDAARLAEKPNLRVVPDQPNGVIIIEMDERRDSSPFVLDADGQPMARNPFKDVRVRSALSKAINRDAIVARVLSGAGVAASQLLPDGGPGASPRLHADTFDPAEARALLAQAGYPQGFRVTLHVPSDRFTNGSEVAQGVAQMLSRIGVRTQVEALPSQVFYPKRARAEFSLDIIAWFNSEMSAALKGILATVDPARGWGVSNVSGYSNPQLDALLERAQATLDEASRNQILAQASELAMADLGVIPLYYPKSIYGMKRTLMIDTTYPANALAQDIHPAKPAN